MEERPNPDEILARVKAEDSHRGKLKVFFGAVAGVGKTYTMLEAARLRKKEGVDLIVGYVETHKRAETEALLEGLNILPPKVVRYKNVELREFDIDAALERNPNLILVDELAHTNVPGSRHPKRWQDVEELLDHGINVYTTLNVQHWESATDIVAQVTGITVRETVPDTIIENADEIELVDLPAEELLKRLKEGKVYLGAQAERAAQHFFQPGNLIALRQLALRYTEHNVTAKLGSYKQLHSISKVWNVRDHFLVCLSESPSGVRLIRAGKRIASDLGVGWIVAHVTTLNELHQEEKNRISEMMRFAEKLGARTVTLSGREIAETLISYARSNNITKIIVGKPGKRNWREFLFGSVIDELARKCGEIDLYLISGDTHDQPIKSRPVALPSFSWNNFLWTTGIVLLCTLINLFLFLHLALVNLIMVYLLGLTWVAFWYGRRLSIVASFFSVCLFDFFFVPPYFSFAVHDIQYGFTFMVMLVIGFTIAHLTGLLRRQTVVMQIREDRTQVLYALSRDLSRSSYPEELFNISLKHIQEFFKCPAVLFIPDVKKKLEARFGGTTEKNLTSNEFAVAQWVYEHRKTAGKGTDTLPGSSGVYLPFVGSEKIVGVIGVFPAEEKQFVDPGQFHMLEMFVSQTALAVEGAQLAAAAIDAESKIENERFRNLLLTTFSSDLTGPLASISQTASELLKPENVRDDSKRAALTEKMRQEAERLNNLVAELPKIIESENPA
jgi:two-component system, OmpR family, sensor histidine kinase KdpD